MTLPPHKIGDRGQRYALEAKGWPRPDWANIMYGTSVNKLKASAAALFTAPGCTEVRVIDRNEPYARVVWSANRKDAGCS